MGDLYPVVTKNQANSSSAFTSVFTALFSSLWHSRLGHPGAVVLISLRSKKFIECNKTYEFFLSIMSFGKTYKIFI